MRYEPNKKIWNNLLYKGIYTEGENKKLGLPLGIHVKANYDDWHSR